MQRNIIFLLLILQPFLIESQTISSGLHFASHTAIKEKRTSLEASPHFDASKGFTLDFDIQLRPELHNYGYIFRIIIDENRSYDLIANFSKERRSLNLIENNNIYLSFQEAQLQSYLWNTWTHIQCHIQPNSIQLTFNGQTLKKDYVPIVLKNVRFNFGYSSHPKFHSSDVPPMCIRNIKITNEHKKTIAYWPLSKHSAEASLDSLHNIPATVTNATWEINKHTKWSKKKTLRLPVYTQICQVPSQNSIFFSNSSYVLRYSMINNTVDTILPHHGMPYTEKNNQIIYNSYYHELWSYDFDTNKNISYFDFTKHTWSNNDSEIKNPDFSQHNAFISPSDSCLYVFGGYGNYQYKNKILKKSRLENCWKAIPYKGEILPRYLSGSGYRNPKTILLFGGCGNPQGKQELGIINYYDLYSIDIQTFKTKKLWSISYENTDNFVVGNNIIVDEKSNKFYALCFPNDCSNSYILLKSFNLEDGTQITNYADTIPFTFSDINSFCTLYYDSLQSLLYAVTSYNYDNNADIAIYSLAYPPLEIKETLQKEINSSYTFSLWILILAGCCCALIVLGGYYHFKKRKTKKQPAISECFEEISHYPDSLPEITASSPCQQSSILFLDGFQVWDRDGQDITKLFTPILKQLLVLIILYSENNQKGISNVTLRELLWFDKEDESAQNNRRVNIRKLKLLLEKLDGIELVKESTYWSVKFTKTYCDYIEVCKFINQVKEGHSVTSKNIHTLLLRQLASQLLPYIQSDWLDHFKSEYSNSILDVSMKLSKLEFIQRDNDLLIQIANIMFAHDKTDEYALTLKCVALYRNGRMGLAKTTFDTFCNEYKTILNVDYTKTFNEIINNK